MLKRYKSSELGESGSRRVGYDCIADYAKSSKANCRVCKKNIEQNELRLALMLQDEEGYKSTAWTHFNCFWKHPETKKLDGTHEIHNFAKLKAEDREMIATSFENLHATKTKSKRTSKNRDNDDSDEEDFSPKTKSVATKIKKKNPLSNKRKRDLEED